MSFLNQVLENTTAINPSLFAAPQLFASRDIKPTPALVENKGIKSVNFTVDTLPLSSERGTIEKKKGLFVGDKCINVVSDRYRVHQPSEILAKFNELANANHLTVEKVVANKANGGLLVSAKVNDCKIVGEDHNVNLVFYTSHCGKYKTTLACNLLRIACFNQLPTLVKNKQRHIYSEKHYNNVLCQKTFENTLLSIPVLVEKYNEQANILRDVKFSIDDFVEFACKQGILDKKSSRYEKSVRDLMETYNYAPGQRELDNTAYKAYQALTYDNTHKLRNTAMIEETRNIKNVQESAELLLELLEVAI